jgi:hypothetical protein
MLTNRRFPRSRLLRPPDAYEATSRATEKTKIAMKVITEMKGSGCRFLREADEGGGYVEIDDSTARAKIAHRFRTLRRNQKKKIGGTSTNEGSQRR